MFEKVEYGYQWHKMGIAVLVLMVFLLTSGCSRGFTSGGEKVAPAPPPVPAAVSPTNKLVQSSDAGNVVIEVKWVALEGEKLVFEVALNTHSVDLDEYDLGELVVLRDDSGREYRPVAWESAPGGHHRQGTLTFSSPDFLNQGGTKYLQMVIRDVAGIKERVFRWELRQR